MEMADYFSALLASRQTILPKRLIAPGPDAAQLQSILDAAGHAPDHERLLPWRLVLIPAAARAALGQAFAEALLERDAAALPEQVQQARDKAERAPLLLLLLVDAGCGDPEIDFAERVLSAGCAVQNMLLMATALGFGSALTSGKALKAGSLRRLFGLSEQMHAVCFLSVGTVERAKPPRVRPRSADYVTSLNGDAS